MTPRKPKKVWTAAEDRELLQLHRSGISIPATGRAMGLSRFLVEYRLYVLNAIHRKRDHKPAVVGVVPIKRHNREPLPVGTCLDWRITDRAVIPEAPEASAW